MKKQLLGISLYPYTIADVTEEIMNYVDQRKTCVITTPNPEIMIEASKNPPLLEVLKQATFAICDGVGLHFFTGAPVIKGRQLFEALLAQAEKNSLSVYILTGSERTLSGCFKHIQLQYPNIKTDGAVGPLLTQEARPTSPHEKEKENVIVKDILFKKPNMVFIGFGCPKQELWMQRLKEKIPQICWMTVGGTLDTYSGAKQTPPQQFVSLKLEWLYRLIIEPKRFKRIITAILEFPLLILTKRIT